MNRRIVFSHHIILSVVLLLGIVLISACGGGDSTPSGSSDGEQSAEPTPTPEPKPIIVEAGTGLEDLDSYVVNFTMEFEGEGEASADQSGTMDMVLHADNINNKKRMTVSASGEVFGTLGEDVAPPEADVYTVDGTSYILDKSTTDNPECQISPINFMDLFSPEMVVGELIGTLEVSTLVAENETVNGVATDHYTVDEDADVFAQMDMDQIDSAQADVWVAREGGYLVKLDLHITGSDSSGQAGAFNIVYTIAEVGQVDDIQLPAACENAEEMTLPDEIPGLEDLP